MQQISTRYNKLQYHRMCFKASFLKIGIFGFSMEHEGVSNFKRIFKHKLRKQSNQNASSSLLFLSNNARNFENPKSNIESSIRILDASRLAESSISTRSLETTEKKRRKEQKKKRNSSENTEEIEIENAVSERHWKRCTGVPQFYRIRLFMRNIHWLGGARTLKGVFTLPWL